MRTMTNAVVVLTQVDLNKAFKQFCIKYFIYSISNNNNQLHIYNVTCILFTIVQVLFETKQNTKYLSQDVFQVLITF